MPKSYLNTDVITQYTKHVSKIAVIWDVTVCSLDKCWHFSGHYKPIFLEVQKWSWLTNSAKCLNLRIKSELFPVVKLCGVRVISEISVLHCGVAEALALLGYYRYIQITWYLSCLTLHTAVVSMVWPMLGSHQHGQAMLYLFQKHLLCWE